MRRGIEVFNGFENTSFLLDSLFSSLLLALFIKTQVITAKEVHKVATRKQRILRVPLCNFVAKKNLL